MTTNKIIRFAFLSLSFVFLFVACRKDRFIDEDIETPYSEILKVVNVNGIVFDENNTPLPDVTVTIGERNTVTDENGVFIIRQSNLTSLGTMVKFEKSSYFDMSRIIYPNTNKEQVYVKISMESKDDPEKFQANTGGTINVNGGAKVEFTGESIIDSNGELYSGEVNVFTHWYNPLDEQLSINAPASLEGIDQDGMPKILQSFGMMAVELESPTGEKLQLAADEFAELTFPIPASISTDSPTSIPLWSVDEETGIWIAEFTAIKEGDTYVGSVNHFSFWNCDAPFELVTISGTLVTEGGLPINNQAVSITLNGISTGYGYTDNTGFFTGKIPKDELLTLKIQDCDIEFVNMEIGPFSSNVDIGSISIDLITSSSTITASLKGCVGENLSGAYGIINNTQLVTADSDGTINTIVTACSNASNQVKFYDSQQLNISDFISLDLSIDQNDLGEVTVCNQLDEFLTFNVDGGDFTLIETPEAYIINGDKLYITGRNTLSYSVNFEIEPINGLGEFQPTSTSFGTPPSSAASDGALLNCNNEGDFSCSQFEVTITEYDLSAEMVAGTFEGLLQQLYSTETDDVIVTGSFRSKIVDQFDEASVSGRVWIDLNGNGTRDLDEEDPTICGITFTRDADPTPIKFGARSVESLDGTYSFTGLQPGTYFLRMYNTNYKLTDFQSGDPTKDNDFFEPGGGIQNYYSYSFTLSDGENLENVDLGFKAPDNITGFISSSGCAPEINLTFNTSSGLKPYTAELSDGQIGTFTDDEEIEFTILTGGDYTITVTDALGNSTTANKIVDSYSTNVVGRIWDDTPGTFEGLYESQIDDKLENVEIRLYNIVDELIQTAFSDNGYNFSDIEYGDYYVEVITPTGYSISQMDPDEYNGSDINTTTGRSEIFKIDECFQTVRINAGFKQN